MAIEDGGAVKSIQKLKTQVPSQAYPQGTTVLQFTMPFFSVADPENAVVQNVWWRRVSGGALTSLLAVFGDVTGVNEVTVLVNNPGASITMVLQVGGTVVEYG